MSLNPDSLDPAKQLELISAFEFTQLIYAVAKLRIPDLLKAAVPHLESHGVLDRCEIVPGDALQSVPEGADLYVLACILHIFQDDKAKLILNNCRRAIGGQGGKLMIVEGVVPKGSSPSPSKNRDITMLYLVGGAERTEGEWQNILKQSGFELEEIRETGFQFDLILANPA